MQSQTPSPTGGLRPACPRLEALRGRGPVVYTGRPRSYLRVEVLGEELHISGATPLVDNGETYLRAGTAYRYVAAGRAAEQLLKLLEERYHTRPERAIAQQYEFSRPDNPLHRELDRLGLVYEYAAREEEELR